MRLVCPNCDAKYEVPDDAIPDGGRDVQCSACGHGWFQLPPDIEAAAEEEAALFGDDLPAAAETTVQPGETAAQPEPEPEPEDADDDGALAAAIGAAVAGESGPALAAEIEAVVEPAEAAPRQDLDEDVRAVLREEAEREAEARRVEAQRAGARRAEAEGQMQVQPDLGVEAPASAPAGAAMSATQRRLAMLKGEDPDAPPPEPPKPAARRDLLPDVEEINSTLQPGDAALDAEVDALPDLTRQRSSFRSGFFMTILLLVIAAAVYVMAPQLAEQFPSLKGPLDSYVAFVDALRIWLNAKMNSATAMLTGEKG